MELDKKAFAMRLDEYLARITPFGFSGALLVASDSQVLVRRGYGLADWSENLANTPETVFCLGSVTKQFTAAAVMRLFELGKLDPQDPVGKYIGGFPEDKSGITLHHLLTHTSGLASYTGGDYEPADREQLLETLLEAPLQFSPGSDYAYSNAGYSLLAALVEIVSGQPYEQFLYEHLLAPAGLEQTGYRRPDWDGRRIASWYRGAVDNGHALEKHYPSWNVLGNGEMLSTLDDLLHWDRALRDGRVLGKETQARMYTPAMQEYGYGWRIGSTGYGTLIEHNGASDLGSSALFRRYLDAGLVVVLFCNRSYGGLPMVQPLQDVVEQLLDGERLVLPPEAGPFGAEDLAALEGRFRLTSGGEVQLSREGPGLTFSAEGQDAINFLAFPEGPPSLHTSLNEVTLAAFSAAAGGDFDALFALMEYSQARRARVQRMVTQHLETAETAYGALRALEMVGTVPSTFYPQALDTLLGLRFEGGSAAFISITREGRNIGVAALEELDGFALPAVPYREGILGYHIPLGRTFKLDTLLGETGEVTGLQAIPGGQVAKRV